MSWVFKDSKVPSPTYQQNGKSLKTDDKSLTYLSVWGLFKVRRNSMMGWDPKNLELRYCNAKLISDIISVMLSQKDFLSTKWLKK